MTPSNLPERIDPKDCKETDCHLKCSRAMRCMTCGKRRATSTDWRTHFFFAAFFMATTMAFLAMASSMASAPQYEKVVGTAPQFFAANWICLVIGIGGPIAAIIGIFYANFQKSNSKRCGFENCQANLLKGQCKQCGSPPNVKPVLMFYVAGLFAPAGAIYGGCMSSGTRNEVTTSVGNIGFIICTAAILVGLIGLMFGDS